MAGLAYVLALTLTVASSEQPYGPVAPTTEQTARADEPGSSDGLDLLRWEPKGMYFAMGLGPLAALHGTGFHPGMHYDMEIGMHAQRRRHTRLFVGADARLMHYSGRAQLAGGVDAVTTLSVRRLYGRLGVGMMTGLPLDDDLSDYHATLGGTVGAGLQAFSRGSVRGRLGLEYDLRFDRDLRSYQTVLLRLSLVFGKFD
jgi:hypothetical protein